MDRKGIIAIVLCMLVLVGWQLKTQRDYDAWKKANPEAAAAAEAGGKPAAAAPQTPAPAADAPAVAPVAGEQAAPTEQEVEETFLTVTTPAVEYRFTNKGGGIATAKLLRHEGFKEGEKMTLNTGAPYPLGAVLSQPGQERAKAYTLRQEGNQVIAERTEANGLQTIKTFTLPGEGKLEEYNVGLKVAFRNTGGVPIEKAGYTLFAGSTEPGPGEYPTYTGFDWFKDGDLTFIDTAWFDASRIPLVGITRSPGKSVYSELPGGVVWAGVKNQYFTSFISTKGAPANGVWAERFATKVDEKDAFGISGALTLGSFHLEPGATTEREFTLFAGPKEYRILKAMGQGEAEIMNFGIFKIICVFLLRSMNWLEGWLHSYALAIIVLTFIVRGALWPVQGKATASMKKMQLVQPKMAELKEKYKDDPTRMNQEIMKMYKDYGINPFAGCLPMLIQIPIFFGFYSMLGTAVELRNSHFLWVADLSKPDTIFHIAGFPINILPLLMAGTMVWQMQLTPKAGDPMQQKIFMFMPLIFVVFTYNFASALALYYTVQNILSIVQLYVTRDAPAPELVKATASRAKPGRSGKRGR